MNIIQVSNTDLPGRKFNGHDLQLSLNKLGHTTHQLVLEKLGKEESTVKICDNNELFVRSILRKLEYQLSMANLIYPFGKKIVENNLFMNADIVHYHLIHNHFISILDFPKLINLKPSVWTIHDPWVITGHCIYPLECMKWKNGCMNCPKLSDAVYPMQFDKAGELWSIKKEIYKKIDMDIVVPSKFMADYIKNSPLTAHFNNLHIIPFGIDTDCFKKYNKQKSRKYFNIPNENFVIAFRAEDNEIKGTKYVIEMLNKLNSSIPITVITLGSYSLPKDLFKRYNIIELGWQNDNDVIYSFYAASDIFIMPSLAETFGLMSIEAMASGCPVIVFENTVLPEITFAPECGIAVPY